MNILQWTQRFFALGIAIMPLYHRSKEPMLSSWHWLQDQLPDTEYLARWFPTDWNNYAVICGWTNLVVIDFDNIEFFNIWKLWLSGTQYVSLGAFQVRTCKGMHVYVRTEQPACNDKRITRSGGIDIQAQGKYVVGPGCVHPSGHIYEPIGEMVFPVVESIEAILPLDLFPRVTPEASSYTGAPVIFTGIDTEYQIDPLTDGKDLISKVKASVRIESLFTGVQRSSVDGRWLKALCLFHDDHKQSAWIDTVRQLAGCQVCGMKPMDVINVFARTRRVSESAAVKMLAEEINIWR